MTPPTRGRLDELDQIFAKDFINFAAGFEPVKSLAAMKKLIAELLLAFPDWHVTVEDMFAQDNKVVTRWSLAATHLAPYHDIPATGLKICAEGIHIDHIVGDQIAKRWACNNFAEVFNRLRAHGADIASGRRRGVVRGGSSLNLQASCLQDCGFLRRCGRTTWLPTA